MYHPNEQYGDPPQNGELRIVICWVPDSVIVKMTTQNWMNWISKPREI